MKKVILASVLVLFLTLPSLGNMTIIMGNSFGSAGGGEYRITYGNFPSEPVSLGEVDGKYESFCLEKSEGFKFGDTYYAKISTATDAGGYTGGSPDPLDPMTAYLYENFINRTLAGYDYTPGTPRVLSADALQHVIWYIEGEEGMLWTPGDGSLMDQLYQDAQANAGNSIGNVRVVNVYGTPEFTDLKQDHIVLMPHAPAPGALLLGSLGTVLVGYLRRRRSL